MTDRPISVSDHAVLRYLERVLQEDVEALREEIAEIIRSAEERADTDQLPEINSVLKDGFRFCVRRGVVTTVMPAYWPDQRAADVAKRMADD